MNQTFTGTITEIRIPRTGTTKKGDEWANTEFEITELNAEKSEYAQKALFDFFKMGEYLKYAKEFESYYKLGDTVTVHFNFKANDYKNSKGENVKFYKTSAWKIEKTNASSNEVTAAANNIDDSFEPNEDDLPFN